MTIYLIGVIITFFILLNNKDLQKTIYKEIEQKEKEKKAEAPKYAEIMITMILSLFWPLYIILVIIKKLIS